MIASKSLPDTTGAPAPRGSAAPPQTEIASLRRRLEFQRLLGEVSTHFINLPAEEIDTNIVRALARVGSFLGFNLVAVSKLSAQDKTAEVTHIWTAEGLPPFPSDLTHLDFPWVAARVFEGRQAHADSLDDLPPAGRRDRETYERLGIQSAYNWPLQVAGTSVGCLGLVSVGQVRSFPVEFEAELELLAQVLASALDRQRADLALRESEARLDLAADAAGVGLWRLNLATGVYWLTNKTRELFGFAANEEVTFERFLGLVHPDDRELIRHTVETVVQSKNQGLVEYRIIRTDGSLRWMLSRGRAHGNTSGHAQYLMGVSVDITERRQLTERLQSAAQEWQATFDSISDPLVILDVEHRVIRANVATVRFLALPMEKIVGSLCCPLMHGAACTLEACPCQKTFQTKLRSELELFNAVTGKWLLLSTDPIKDAAGNVIGAVHVGKDVTGHKQTEETLRNLSGRLIAAQEQERARLARELHDGLSQNLALQAVELELMGQRPPTTAAEISRRMQGLSDQMKKLSSEVHRISHDLHPAKLTQLGLTAAIAELCHAGSSAPQIPISFSHNRIPRTLPPGVALCIYRVAQESIQNAIRHSGAKTVRVELAMEADQIRLGVADDGRGFDVESKQITSTLGLVSMRERVRLVHGEIRIESSPVGTRISVSIPLRKGTES